MSFLRYGLQACVQYSKWGLTIALYRGTIKLLSLYVIFLRIIPRTWLTIYAAILHCSETFKSVLSSDIGRDRFASSGRAFSSAGSRIISLETIDQTETGRRWLTMFTFLRLQSKSYNGQQAYKVTKQFKLRRKLPRCDVWIWRPPFTKIVRPIISEKSVMGPRCKSTGTFWHCRAPWSIFY